MSEKKSFQEFIQGEQPVLVDFYADWCKPCQIQGPMLEDFKQQMGEQVTVLKVDVDRNPSISESLSIRNIPTMILFKNGQAVWRYSGVLRPEQLIHEIQPHLTA
ncbi:MAG: thioredoxin [Flavobacteriales bacterium]